MRDVECREAFPRRKDETDVQGRVGWDRLVRLDTGKWEAERRREVVVKFLSLLYYIFNGF